MRAFFLIVLFFGSSNTAMAQACGYTFLTLYLINSEGKKITNAEIKTFRADFKKEDLLDYPRSDDWSDRLSRKIAWSEKKQAFFGSEGLCGGHRDVGLRVSATGFEVFDKIIDLPLGWTSYSIRLQGLKSSEIAFATKLSHVYGNVADKMESVIPDAEIVVFDIDGRQFRTVSNEDGRFEIDVPLGTYRISILKNGFKRLTVVNFQITEPTWEHFDLTLKVRGCDDCKRDIFVDGDQINQTEETLDYQLIKKNKRSN